MRSDISPGPDWDLGTPGLRERWDTGDLSPFHGWDWHGAPPALTDPNRVQLPSAPRVIQLLQQHQTRPLDRR